MRRIGFISTNESVPWGGSEPLWAETAARLRRAGHEIYVNTGRWTPMPEPIVGLQQIGCHVHIRRASNAPIALGRRQRLRLALAGEMPYPEGIVPEVDDCGAMCAWLDSARPEFVIISQGYYLEGFNSREACRVRQIPFASLIHAAAEQFWPNDSSAAALARSYEEARVNYFVSHRTIDFVRRTLATPLQNVEVVRNPYNATIGADPIPFPAQTEPLRLACIGRLDCMQKGQDLLFEVLRTEKWKQRPLKISVYGTGPNEETLRRLQKQYEITNIEFCGFVSDVASIWREHHALVLPSRYEGLPLVVVEAMLCGRPCIVTDVMGNAELLKDGETGFVAEAATPRHIDAAMEAAWQARAQWLDMGRRAAEAVRLTVPQDPVGAFAAEVLRRFGAKA